MKLTVLLTTYKRTKLAIQTIQSTINNLRYDNYQIIIYDDGSPEGHVKALRDVCDPVDVYVGNRKGVGHGMNWGIRRAAELDSNYVLTLEDDWELVKPLNPVPAMKLLENPEFGMVRFGYLSAGAKGKLISGQHKLWFKFEPYEKFQYSYAGHPSIKHARFHKEYGMFAEGLSPKQNELNFCSKVNQKPNGPAILWCMDYNYMGPYHHIGTESLGDISPNV